MTDQIETIDLRGSFFKVSNDIFKMGLDVYGIAVYSLFCRYANNDTKKLFPSITHIQETLKISRRKTISVIQELCEKDIILKKKGFTGNSNRYYLLPLNTSRIELIKELNGAPDALPDSESAPHAPHSAHDAPSLVHEGNSKKTNTKKTESKKTKHIHGEFQKVLLTEEDYTKLKVKFPTDIKQRIQRLDDYIASTGKKYSNHYATILSWSRKDAKKTDTRKI